MEIDWNLTLGVCTLLGGASAVWFFWDKVTAVFRPKVPSASPVPTQQGGSAVYTEGSGTAEITNMAGGEMIAGRGGSGGAGGHAIKVADGAGVVVVNHGRIVGGDAGGSDKP